MKQALREFLPPPLDAFVAWLLQPEVIGVMVAISVGTLILSAVGIPWILARMPADYFTPEAEARRRREEATIWWHVLGGLLRNVLGGLLVFSGFLMLFIPGQGVATMLAGLLVMRFPKKRELLRRWLKRPKMRRMVDRLRRRGGHAPLRFDDEPSPHGGS
ncbi:MAG: PGPGW domain-containing protein [Myxococcota bacterium]